MSLLLPSASSRVDVVFRGVEGIRCREMKSCDIKSPVAPQSTKAVPKVPLILAVTVNFSSGDDNRMEDGSRCPNILQVYTLGGGEASFWTDGGFEVSGGVVDLMWRERLIE
jgi:hypothetical protein